MFFLAVILWAEAHRRPRGGARHWAAMLPSDAFFVLQLLTMRPVKASLLLCMFRLCFLSFGDFRILNNG